MSRTGTQFMKDVDDEERDEDYNNEADGVVDDEAEESDGTEEEEGAEDEDGDDTELASDEDIIGDGATEPEKEEKKPAPGKSRKQSGKDMTTMLLEKAISKENTNPHRQTRVELKEGHGGQKGKRDGQPDKTSKTGTQSESLKVAGDKAINKALSILSQMMKVDPDAVDKQIARLRSSLAKIGGEDPNAGGQRKSVVTVVDVSGDVLRAKKGRKSDDGHGSSHSHKRHSHGEKRRRTDDTSDTEDAAPAKKTRKRVKRDPNAPKKALSAYIFFSNEWRAKHPSTDDKPAVADEENGVSKSVRVMREIGAAWQALTPESKRKYTMLADADKERYAKELVAYMNTKGAEPASTPAASDVVVSDKKAATPSDVSK